MGGPDCTLDGARQCFLVGLMAAHDPERGSRDGIRALASRAIAFLTQIIDWVRTV
jgi:hypothetical protein